MWARRWLLELRMRTIRTAGALVAALLLGACGSDDAGGEEHGTPPGEGTSVAPTGATGVWLIVGDDIDARPRARIAAHLAKALGKAVTETTADALPAQLDAGALVVSIGATSLATSLVPDDDRAKLGPEGYVLKAGTHHGAMLLVAHGNAKADSHAPRASSAKRSNLGALHGAYALLEALGFGFLHPLAPMAPEGLAVPTASSIDRTSAPRWKKRATHLHTQHPLELTDMLQGFGPGGPTDAAGFEATLDEWDRFLEWSVANGQNGVEWFLLWAESWKDFADSPERLTRLRMLVDRAHAFGIDAGIDAPIAFAQQHSYRLLREEGELPDELAQIRTRLDALTTADFDFYGIEAGTSEFTHPSPERMLAWMNEVAKHLDEKHGGTRAYIKVHCSSGQVAEGYLDPKTGKDINFNMLPHFADPRLGVLPHTVQHYGLTDPAPTYGNTDFGYIRDFLRSEVGKRPVVFYPETAYWVSFDIDVPLFLPIYGERRLSDLRLLSADEIAAGDSRMDGQLVFSSGWEWGYWLNDVLAARAAWQPELEAGNRDEALTRALAPITRVFGAAGPEATTWLVDVIRAEENLLIGGKVAGKSPDPIAMRNGQAYLQGWETWDDVSKLAFAKQMTQPDKLGLVDMRNPLHGGPGYSAEVDPLLAEMDTVFGALAARGDALREKVPASARDLFDDLADAMRMTALRAAQVHGLYDYVDGFFDAPPAERMARLGVARTALDDAKVVVAGREKRYRVPADRIAGWRKNPTAYPYGFLWTARTLHFWWRDEGKAIDHPASPCYMNILNPVDVAFGEGIGTDAARVVGDFLSGDDSRGCLAEPASEPTFPQDNLRSRP